MNRHRHKFSKLAALLGVAGLAAGVLAALTVAAPLHAQQGGWTSPEVVYEGNGVIDNPVIVADAYGQVHGFWVLREEVFGESGRPVIFYSRLDDPQWRPIDIFVVGGNGGGLSGSVYRDGLALLVNGGEWAYSGPSPAATAKEWYGPSDVQQAYANSSVASGADGTLWTAYGAPGGGINVQRLNPDTNTWEAPKLVGDTANTNAAADWVRLAVDRQGMLHVVWSEYQLPNGWPPQGIYYAQSADGGLTWTRRRLGNGGYNQPNVVIGPHDEIYLTWTGTAGVSGKYFQESLDGGRTWGDVTALLPAGSGGGSEGQPALVVDAAGGLHVVYSNLGCVWYVTRPVDQPWSEPECISADVKPELTIEYPALTIRLGNELHVLFNIDRRQLWHTSLTLDLPAETPLPIPVLPTATPVPPTATIAPTATTTPLPDFGAAPTTEMVTGPGLFSIAAGAVPVVLLVLLVLVGRRRGPIRQ